MRILKFFHQLYGGLSALFMLAWYRDPQDQHRPSPGQFKANHESIGQKGFIRKHLLAGIFAVVVLYPFALLISVRGVLLLTLVGLVYVVGFVGIQFVAISALNLDDQGGWNSLRWLRDTPSPRHGNTEGITPERPR